MPYYHVWFSPKKRKAILEGEIADVVRAALLGIARAKGIRLSECESSYDHVHMLVDVQDGQTLPGVMHQLKGASAHEVFRCMPELKFDVGDASFWQRGYGYRRLEPSELFRVRQYIRNHREPLEPRVANPRASTKSPTSG